MTKKGQVLSLGSACVHKKKNKKAIALVHITMLSFDLASELENLNSIILWHHLNKVNLLFRPSLTTNSDACIKISDMHVGKNKMETKIH